MFRTAGLEFWNGDLKESSELTSEVIVLLNEFFTIDQTVQVEQFFSISFDVFVLIENL